MANSKRYLYSHTQAQRFACFLDLSRPCRSITSSSNQSGPHFLFWFLSWLFSCSSCNGLNVLTLPPVMVFCIYSLCGAHCPRPPSSCVHLLCHVNYFLLFVFYPSLAVMKMLTHHCMACYLLLPNCGVSLPFLALSVVLVLMPVLKSNIFLSTTAEREEVGMESKLWAFAVCHLFSLPSRHLGNLVFISQTCSPASLPIKSITLVNHSM